MANPYVDGTKNNLFIGSKDMSITSEMIDIFLARNLSDVTYRIKYEIVSEKETMLPLMFIASNYRNNFSVKVNGVLIDKEILKEMTSDEFITNYKYISVQNDSQAKVSFRELDYILTDIDDLVKFDANIKNGTNTIEVSYNASNGFNKSDWFIEPTLEYTLSPSKYWKSFENISIKIHSEKPFKIISSNIGKPIAISKNKYKKEYNWQLKKIETDYLKLQLSPKVSLLSSTLISMEPIGIALIVLVVFFVFHIKYLIAESKIKEVRFNKPLWYGNLIVPAAFVLTFLVSFSIIDLTLGASAGGTHGYNFLILFALPVFWIGYSLFMWLSYKIYTSKS